MGKILRVLLLSLLVLLALFVLQQPTPPKRLSDATITMIERAADFYLLDFSTRTLTAEGDLRHILSGDTLTHYPDNDVSEIQAPTLLVRQPGQGDWQITANSGRLLPESNNLELQGKVVMLREQFATVPALQIRAQFLRMNTVTNTLEADDGVSVESADWRAYSTTVHGNTETGDLTLQNNVVIRYAPAP